MIPSPALIEAETLFGELVWTPGIKALQLNAEVELPFLGFPVVRTIFEGVTGLISSQIYKQLILLVDISAIKLVNEAHQKAFDTESLRLKVIAHEKGIDSDEFLKARETAVAALSAFVRVQ